MNASRTWVPVCVVVVGLVAAQAMAVSILTVPVGNPGNAGELSGAGAYSSEGHGPDRICGAVDYTYNIGKYPVTAGEYTAFLNKVAGVDTYGLYNTRMWTSELGCKIERYSGDGTLSNPYQFRVASDWANRPVNNVSWGDAARFANWLHNGQPAGADAWITETGAYTLNGAMTRDDLLAITRNADWKWAITSEDEWYKAAYHKNDGTDYYWLYPTSSDRINATMANYAYVWDTTDVGAYPYPSPYGTFDQGGNVWEWNEAVIATHHGLYRGLRGGSFHYCPDAERYLLASYRNYNCPSNEYDVIGFRVVQVPEPTSMALLALGGVGLFRRRRGLVR